MLQSISNVIQTTNEFLHDDLKEKASLDYGWFERIRTDIEPYLRDLSNKGVLDVGCGDCYPLTLLFHTSGVQTVGIDTKYTGVGGPPIGRLFRRLSNNGVLETATHSLYSVLGRYRAYYAVLSQRMGCRLETKNPDVRVMSVNKMAFPDQAFDLVVSMAVFEHLRDVDGAVAEIKRVLRPGGIAYINIHLFSSLSGGHRRYPRKPSTSVIPPWDHLRDNLYPPRGTCFLNKLREADYVATLRRHLGVLEVLDIGKGERENLLTPEILRELSGYSRDELTKRGITVIATRA